MCPNGAQRGLWDSPLKDAAPLATLYQSLTDLYHHGPPESFLCKGQSPLLTLMPCITMDSIEGHAMLVVGTRNAKIPSASPSGMVLMYSNPLLMTRPLHTWKSTCPSSVFVLSPRYFLNNASLFGNGVSLQVQSHLLQATSMGSTSWASPQSTICIGAILVAWTNALFPRHSCLPRSFSLTSASPLSTAPTIVPSNRDQTVSWLWQMVTQLKASAAPLSAPF